MDYIYEVETRFEFEDREEVYTVLHFLESCLNLEIEWKTEHFGRDLFKEDRVLRISDSKIDGDRISSLAYKEPDRGQEINIRKEYSERINKGLKESLIMGIVGGKRNYADSKEIKKELKRLGHAPFMFFKGHSLLGKYEPRGLHFKLMYCSYLQYPLLLEIEKEAESEAGIMDKKEDIYDFIEKYGLDSRLIPQEPPTLLYRSEWGE